MAPPRPPEAHIISENYGAAPLGVLVLRAENEFIAWTMAFNALSVDLAWDPARATLAMIEADVREGRWYRVPDHTDDNKARWLMVQAKAGVLKGSSPGWYYRFIGPQDRRSLPESEAA